MAPPDPSIISQDQKDDRFVALSEARGMLGLRQIGVVPGAEVAVLGLELPNGLRGQNREQVALRQLRDQIGIDASTVEIRPLHLPRQADEWTHMMVVDRDAVARWREAAGDSCLGVLPDYLTLPTAQGVWTVAPAAGAQRLALRLGPVDGFGAGEAMAAVLLRRALAEADLLPQCLLRLGPRLPMIEDIVAEFDIEVVTDPTDVNATVLEHGEMAFDLRRDPQLARARLRKRVLPWRWPLLIGVAAAGIWAAAQTVVINRITHETTQLSQQTTRMVQEHFIKTGPVLDARVQVARAVAQAKAQAAGQDEGVDPLDLFARAAAVIAAEGAATVLASYASADGLSLSVTVADFAAAERLASRMRGAGMLVTVRDTRASDTDSGVRTTLDVQPAAGTSQ